MQTSSDVIVIGGGVVGVCVAHFLQEKGVNVTVVEKSGIGSGCSFGNAGFIAPSHIVPLASPGIIDTGLRWILSYTSPLEIGHIIESWRA